MWESHLDEKNQPTIYSSDDWWITTIFLLLLHAHNFIYFGVRSQSVPIIFTYINFASAHKPCLLSFSFTVLNVSCAIAKNNFVPTTTSISCLAAFFYLSNNIFHESAWCRVLTIPFALARNYSCVDSSCIKIIGGVLVKNFMNSSIKKFVSSKCQSNFNFLPTWPITLA